MRRGTLPGPSTRVVRAGRLSQSGPLDARGAAAHGGFFSTHATAGLRSGARRASVGARSAAGWAAAVADVQPEVATRQTLRLGPAYAGSGWVRARRPAWHQRPGRSLRRSAHHGHGPCAAPRRACRPSRAGCRRSSARRCRPARTPSPAGTARRGAAAIALAWPQRDRDQQRERGVQRRHGRDVVGVRVAVLDHASRPNGGRGRCHTCGMIRVICAHQPAPGWPSSGGAAGYSA